MVATSIFRPKLINAMSFNQVYTVLVFIELIQGTCPFQLCKDILGLRYQALYRINNLLNYIALPYIHTVHMLSRMTIPASILVTFTVLRNFLMEIENIDGWTLLRNLMGKYWQTES